jgi:hypothetical protein
MTDETAKNYQSIEDLLVTIDGQIKALTGISIHLLSLSTLQVAVASGNLNLDRVTQDQEDLVREQTDPLTKGDSPAVVTAARRLQKEIFEVVGAQMKNDVRILRVAATKPRRRQ